MENLIILIFVKKRLHETIESAQISIKEVVDTDNLSFECKIYKVMDTAQDMEDILKLQKVIEEHPDAAKQPEAIKKARIGYINLKARTYELKSWYRDFVYQWSGNFKRKLVIWEVWRHYNFLLYQDYSCGVPNQETGLENMGHLEVLNDTKLVLNEYERLP